MTTRFYRVTRDFHLYLGLFVSPFVLLFSASVFFLVHAWLPSSSAPDSSPRTFSGLKLPAEVERLSGRERIDALIPTLKSIGIQGEIGWVQHFPREHRLLIPVTVPGRETLVTVDVTRAEASIKERSTGFAAGLVFLHKSPGPHLVGMRMNWFPMRLWYWFTDASTYMLLLTTFSGIYVWYRVRTERAVGLGVLLCGVVTFFGLVYAIVH